MAALRSVPVARRSKLPPPKHNALVASAAVMAQHPDSMGKMRSADWQNDAWGFYDTVGELRFAVGWLANGMSRVNLVAARHPEFQGDEPSAIEVPDPADGGAELTPIEAMAVDLVSAMAGGPEGQGAMLAQLSIYLSVPGVGYLLMEATPNPLLDPLDDPAYREPTDELPPSPDETWTWRMLSADELRVQGDVYEVADGPSSWRPVLPEHVLVRVWRPHPRRQWEPDSPCRAVLGVLRQISLLDEHVQATAQSRLAGAGILVLPTEVEFAPILNNTAATPPASAEAGDQPVVEDPFTETLVTVMTVPIGDRGSASAVVPLVVRVPGEYVDKVNHITFWSEFQDNVLPLRNSAVERLALGIDLPPEVLTGMAGMNHWGAWQVEETAITLHIEPQAETMCEAFTIGYLQPALRAAGFSEADADEFIVWYDTTDLTTRPDRSADAISVYDRLQLSAAALRREAGLSEDDAPDQAEFRQRVLLQAAAGAPTLAPMMLAEAGLMAPAVADAVAAAPADAPAPGAPAPPPPPPDQGPPERQSLAATLEACDALVHRALERAGTRLQSRVGRKSNGGAATVTCPDPALLHTMVKATDHASLDTLLANAWTRVPDIAERLGYDAESLTHTLDAYTRALIATGHAHDRDRLADALGLAATR